MGVYVGENDAVSIGLYDRQVKKCFQYFSADFWRKISEDSKKIISVIRSVRSCTLEPYQLQLFEPKELVYFGVRGHGFHWGYPKVLAAETLSQPKSSRRDYLFIKRVVLHRRLQDSYVSSGLPMHLNRWAAGIISEVFFRKNMASFGWTFANRFSELNRKSHFSHFYRY